MLRNRTFIVVILGLLGVVVSSLVVVNLSARPVLQNIFSGVLTGFIVTFIIGVVELYYATEAYKRQKYESLSLLKFNISVLLNYLMSIYDNACTLNISDCCFDRGDAVQCKEVLVGAAEYVAEVKELSSYLGVSLGVLHKEYTSELDLLTLANGSKLGEKTKEFTPKIADILVSVRELCGLYRVAKNRVDNQYGDRLRLNMQDYVTKTKTFDAELGAAMAEASALQKDITAILANYKLSKGAWDADSKLIDAVSLSKVELDTLQLRK